MFHEFVNSAKAFDFGEEKIQIRHPSHQLQAFNLTFPSLLQLAFLLSIRLMLSRKKPNCTYKPTFYCAQFNWMT